MLKRTLIFLILALTQISCTIEEGGGMYDPFPFSPESRLGRMWTEAFDMASSSKSSSLYTSLRIAAPFSRPWRQFGARSIERLWLALGEWHRCSTFRHAFAWNGTSFDAKQR